jgi:hypothetical protein
MVFADTSITNNQHLQIAAFVEAASPKMIYGATTQEPAAIDGTQNSDLASLVQSLNLERTFVQYSTSSPYAAISAFGRAFTVDFTGVNTTITLKFKQQPGIVAESLTENQWAALKSKNCNAFVNYKNGRAILQEGVMANGYFFDEVHGLDWLQNAVQTDVFNLLYDATTKIPQTDAGVHMEATIIENTLGRATINGLLAPGIWNAPGFGQLSPGDNLPKGYYVYMPPIASQSEATRATRTAPTAQAAVKLAGAIHFANVLITANR